MAKKKKTKKFNAIKAVKSAAREQLGSPPPTRVVPEERERAAHKASKHKDLDRLLREQGE